MCELNYLRKLIFKNILRNKILIIIIITIDDNANVFNSAFFYHSRH